jgi:transcriptional coactivator HFI1/ADA1
VPLAQSSRAVPSANQLGSRIAQIAQTCGLDVAPDVQREVGEFMGVGLTTHLADIVQSSKHMLGRDRPGLETVRVPLGIKTNGVNVGTAAPHANGANGTANANGSANGTANGNVDHPVGPSSLHTMQYLFTLHPGLNPQASPTLYKLQSGMTQAEVEKASRPQPVRAAPSKAAASLSMVPTTSASGLPGASQVASALASAPSATAAGATTSPSKAATALHAAAGQGKIDTVASTLVDTGLLKIDKAGHDEQGERKREKKHNLHWKYEDPALIFKDLLG